MITHGFQVMCCLSEPKLEEILATRRGGSMSCSIRETFFMSHDEIRVANWCQACQRPQAVARPAPGRERTAMHGDPQVGEPPSARVVVWSDMFDPHHNAVDNYYLVNGSLEGSWEGLAPRVIIANWNGGKAP